MESLASLYKIAATLQERTRDALARFKLDALLIHSGELFNVFLDDHPCSVKVDCNSSVIAGNSGAKLLVLVNLITVQPKTFAGSYLVVTGTGVEPLPVSTSGLKMWK